jgi:hypothetical protein
MARKTAKQRKVEAARANVDGVRYSDLVSMIGLMQHTGLRRVYCQYGKRYELRATPIRKLVGEKRQVVGVKIEKVL